MEKQKLLKNIYIAKDFNSIVIGLILARDKDIAKVFFDGKYPSKVNSIEEIDIEDIDKKIPGQLYFNIIETEELSINYKDKVRVTIQR